MKIKCLELSRKYYKRCILPLMKEYFPELIENHTSALIGWGSEVLGYDDEISKYYGWGPKPKIFLKKQDYEKYGEELWNIFNKKLPTEFLGFPARFKVDSNDGLPKSIDMKEGFPFVAISTFERLHKFYLGDITYPYSDIEWLLIPEQKLLEITSGEVYYDGLDILKEFRENICYFPDNVWYYKLAYQWETLNWELDLIRLCKKRGDLLSAKLSIIETIKRVISIVFLLNKAYRPGIYKWIHRQFLKLPELATDIEKEINKIFNNYNFYFIAEKIDYIIERLIKYQVDKNIIVKDEYKKKVGRGYSNFNINLVKKNIKVNISSAELKNLPFSIGAVDQWITDEDLLQSPNRLKVLKSIYYSNEPERKQLGDHLL